MNIIQGNALIDGQDFRFWIVGCIERWCREKNMPFDSETFGIRNTENIEVKWGVYGKGDVRPEWAGSSDMTGMSILIRGDSLFTFREAKDPEHVREVRLMKEGDYVIWREDVEHSWKMLDDSVFLTIRWRERACEA